MVPILISTPLRASSALFFANPPTPISHSGSIISTISTGNKDFNGPEDDKEVISIHSNNNTFVALRSDGSVISWGQGSPTGSDGTPIDFDGLNNDLEVIDIFSTSDAFAALRSDGSVVSWGNYRWVAKDIEQELNKNIIDIASNYNSFAALKSDGSVVTWGALGYGGESSNIDFD